MRLHYQSAAAAAAAVAAVMAEIVASADVAVVVTDACSVERPAADVVGTSVDSSKAAEIWQHHH